MDPFHVVSWATDVLDGIRKDAWHDARIKDKTSAHPACRRGRPRTGEIVHRKKECALALREARYPLLKNPEDLTERQLLKLEQIAREDKRLCRAYQAKEHLRSLFRLTTPKEARTELDAWLSKTCRSRIPAFVELSKKIRRHRDAIIAAIKHGISNARVEAINNKIKLTVRMGYGFRNIDNLIALTVCSPRQSVPHDSLLPNDVALDSHLLEGISEYRSKSTMIGAFCQFLITTAPRISKSKYQLLFKVSSSTFRK